MPMATLSSPIINAVPRPTLKKINNADKQRSKSFFGRIATNKVIQVIAAETNIPNEFPLDYHIIEKNKVETRVKWHSIV